MIDQRGNNAGADPFFESDFHSHFRSNTFHDPFELFRSFFGDTQFGGSPFPAHFQDPFNSPFFNSSSSSHMMGGMIDPFSFGGPSMAAHNFAGSGNFTSSSSQTIIRNGIRETTTSTISNGETKTIKEKFDAGGKLIHRETIVNGQSQIESGSLKNRITNSN